jgi:alkylation response protein AidB-like acyl-CoA dehydrogenase
MTRADDDAGRAAPRGGAAAITPAREPCSGAVAEFASWLTEFLPDDYYDRYREYRWDLELRRDYHRAAFEAGWLQPTWPREHGGRSLDLRTAMEIRLEAALQSAPKLPNIAGPNVVAPAIRQFGTAEQINRLLVPLLRGDEWWALGMSEPEAGSDFAGLRTRALRDSPDSNVFRVNGRKIWTTQAHLSRWCTLYARTDPAAPKHRGISCLILDLESPGVTIEPIRMASISDETFCEVFLDDVEVPVANLLGPYNDGWQVALSSLHHERQMIWIMNWVEIRRGLDSVRASETVHGDGVSSNASGDIFAELGALLADAEGLRATGYRALHNELAGRPSPEADILKLLGSVTLQRVWELRAAAAGPLAIGDHDLLFERQDALAATIYGGTSEIQRNIIAERLLGLPKG